MKHVLNEKSLIHVHTYLHKQSEVVDNSKTFNKYIFNFQDQLKV